MRIQYKIKKEETNLKQKKKITLKSRQERRRVDMKKVFIIIALASVIMTGCAIDANEINNVRDVGNAINAMTDVKADAYRVSCNAVRAQMNAPSSAKFPSYSSGFVTEESSDIPEYDTMYIVDAYVEGENQMGGTSKWEFGCRVYAKEGSNEYKIHIDYIE